MGSPAGAGRACGSSRAGCTAPAAAPGMECCQGLAASKTKKKQGNSIHPLQPQLMDMRGNCLLAEIQVNTRSSKGTQGQLAFHSLHGKAKTWELLPLGSWMNGKSIPGRKLTQAQGNDHLRTRKQQVTVPFHKSTVLPKRVSVNPWGVGRGSKTSSLNCVWE